MTRWVPRGLRLLFWSLIVAVAALSSVGFFAERVERALQDEGASVLAADLVVEQGRPIPAEWLEKAEESGLQTSQLVTFPSVLFLADRPQLVQVKAVQDNYPMRGQLQIASPVADQGAEITTPPSQGQVAVAPKLALLLQDQDQLNIGEADLKLLGRIVQEPDLGGSLFQLAPRVMISWQDLERTALLGPASRAKYRLLLAGERGQIASFGEWIRDRLPSGAQLLEVGTGRPELSSAIERGQRFLKLAALCASLLAGVAIMLATRRFVSLLLDEVAILRTLGMTSRQVLWRYLRQLITVTLFASVLGVVLGYLVQLLLVLVLGDLLGGTLPAPGWKPVPVALLHAMVLVLGFALPSLLAVRHVPPLRVLRRELGPMGISYGLSALLAIGAYTLLVFWQVQDIRLATAMSIGMLAVLAVFAAVAFVLMRIVQPLRRRGGMAVGLAALSREPGLTLLQLAGFGLGLTLLLLLTLVRVDILETWETTLPQDAPNHFLVNIQPHEAEPLSQLLQGGNVESSGFYPTTRGRLQAINQQRVDPQAYSSPRARRLAAREFSLGFGQHRQADNRILQGRWFGPDEAAFSVEQGLAEQLDIKLGDRLVFDVAGQTLSAPVTSLRSVAWDSFNVNFFVQGSPALLQGLPHAVLTSIYLPDDTDPVLQQVARTYPAVSVISIGALLDKVRSIIARGALAIEGVFLFTLVAAALVSLAAIQISRDQREREIALLRTFGASRRRVLRLVLSEFLALGLVAGVLAALLANLLSVLLAQRLFELDGSFNLPLWLAGTLIGMGLVGLLGFFASRPILKTPPMQLLR